jgi:transcriptional regulator with XRE-family HTH domain
VVRLPAEQCAIAGANIRALRQRRGWSQAELGELMGWPSPSTVCAAEGRRDGRQRRFTTAEIERLAAIFGISAGRLMARCATCGGCPPAGSPAWPAARRSAPASRPQPLTATPRVPALRRWAGEHAG